MTRSLQTATSSSERSSTTPKEDDEQLWAFRQAFAAAEEAMPRVEGPSGEDDDDDDCPY